MNITKAIFSITATALIAGSANAYTVDVSSDLVPTGLVAGDSFQLVFITTDAIQRDLLDGSDNGSDDSVIADWNVWVNAQADSNAHATAQSDIAAINWSAIVSTKDVAAKDNAVVSEAVYRIDGVQVATGNTDMWDGNIANTITVDEDGNASTRSWAWSGGPSYSGSGAIGGQSVGNGTDNATRGQATATTSHWHGHGGHMSRGPNSSEAVYALSEVITVTPEPSSLALMGLGGLLIARRRRA